MSYERKLENVQLDHCLWAEGTIEILQQDLEVREQAEHFASGFVDAVVQGNLHIDQLRRMQRRANTLNREALEIAAYDLESLTDEDYFEGVARQFANQTLSHALGLVRNRRLRSAAQWRRHREKLFAGAAGQATLEQGYSL